MEKLTGVTEFMSSAHYQVQKDIIFREINSLNAPRGFALPRFCEPGRLNTPDTAVFQKTAEERELLDQMKKSFRKEMKLKFPHWTKKTSGKKEFITLYSRIAQ